MNRLVTIDDVAEMLQVSVATVRRLVRSGKIPAVRVGRCLRFDPDEVMVALRRSSTSGLSREAQEQMERIIRRAHER